MTAQSKISRDWIASRTDLYRELCETVDEAVRAQSSITVEEALLRLPEGQRAIWYVGRFFGDLGEGGFSQFFRNSIAADPTARRVVSAYISLNILGLLNYAKLLARGVAVSLDLVGQPAEKTLRSLIGDAGLQAPPHSRKARTAAEYEAAIAKVDQEFHSLGGGWKEHIERFVRSQPRSFTEMAPPSRKKPRR